MAVQLKMLQSYWAEDLHAQLMLLLIPTLRYDYSKEKDLEQFDS